jgi:hypothetical protein
LGFFEGGQGALNLGLDSSGVTGAAVGGAGVYVTSNATTCTAASLTSTCGATCNIFPNGNVSGPSNLGQTYWKIGIYRDQGTTQTQAARYSNLEVVNKVVTDISARIATPLAHPTHL